MLKRTGEMEVDAVKCNWDKEKKKKKKQRDKGKRRFSRSPARSRGETKKGTEMRAREHEGSKH